MEFIVAIKKGSNILEFMLELDINLEWKTKEEKPQNFGPLMLPKAISKLESKPFMMRFARDTQVAIAEAGNLCQFQPLVAFFRHLELEFGVIGYNPSKTSKKRKMIYYVPCTPNSRGFLVKLEMP